MPAQGTRDVAVGKALARNAAPNGSSGAVMIDGTVIAISGNWSVTTDGLQWILRRRVGTDRRTGKPVWESVSFVRSTNDILARCMRGREKAIGRAWGAFFAPAGGQPLPRSPKMPSQRT